MAKSGESSLIKALRTVLSFILAVIISFLSVSICFGTTIFNKSRIESFFNDYNYVYGVKENVSEYAKNIYAKNGISYDNIDDVFSYDAVKQVVEEYTAHYIAERVSFDENTYKKSIDSICKNVNADLTEQVKASGKKINSNAVDNVVQSINNYFIDEVNIKGVEYAATVLNIGPKASYAAIGIGSFFFIFVGLILVFLGEKEKRYRSLRAVCISFLTAGLFNELLSIIVLAITGFKKIDIYPVYLSEQFMKYVYMCISTVAVAGAVLLVLSAFFAVLVWTSKAKKNR